MGLCYFMSIHTSVALARSSSDFARALFSFSERFVFLL